MNCVRGCTSPRLHGPTCEGDDCEGCTPREAKHGRLCYSCHARLRSHIEATHGQWALLQIVAGYSTNQDFTLETTARPSNAPRLSSDAPFPGPWAHASTIAVAESEPVRLAALDAAQALADWLSETVERVAADHNATGPARLHTAEHDPRRWKWLPVWADGTPQSRYDPVVKHRDDRETMLGQYVLTDPPERFAVDTAANWLLAWLHLLEESETVGDDLELLNEIMAQAHAIAPWREQVARLRGIPCPSCGRKALVRFGGDVDVTCVKCKTMIPPARYLIWTRMLVTEHTEAVNDRDNQRGSDGTRGETEHDQDTGATG